MDTKITPVRSLERWGLQLSTGLILTIIAITLGGRATNVLAAPLHIPPVIGVTGTCDISGNSAFTIANTGGAMTVSYIWSLYQEDVFLTSGPIILTAAGTGGDQSVLSINGLYGNISVVVRDNTDVEIASAAVFCENHTRVTINQASGQSDPTASSPILFTAIFQSAVSGFDASDVVITGMAGTPGVTVTGGATVFTIAVTGMAPGETVTATIPANVALSTYGGTGAGFGNQASTSTDNHVRYDPPVIGISSTCDISGNSAFTIANTGGAMTVSYIWSLYQEDVFLTSGPIILTAAGTGGDQSVLSINGLYGNISVVVRDNTDVEIASAAVFCENHTRVTINQASGQSDPTASSPILFTAIFQSAVSGFDASDVVITGMAGTPGVTVTGGATVFTIAVTGMADGETVTATIPANVALSTYGGTGAGFGNQASTSTDNHVTYSVPGPTVTINRAAGQADPAGTGPINFAVVFSEAVTGFATGDVDLSASTAPGTLSGTVSGGPTIYNVAVNGMTGDGTIIATIAAGAATSTTLKPNFASTSTDNTVQYDATAPTTTMTSTPSNPTGSPDANFVFNGADSGGAGLAGFECDLDGSGFGACSSPRNYTGLSDGSHTFRVRALDNAGNADATPASYTWTVDTIAPDVTVDQAAGQSDPANGAQINFTVAFSEAVTGFDNAADVTLSGTAGAATIVITGGPATYNVAVSGMTGNGTVTVSIPAGAATDAAAHLSTVSTSTDSTVSYDATVPTVTIDQASGQSDPTFSGPIEFTAVFSEPVSGFTGADVTLSGTAGATTAAVTEIAPDDGTTYNVEVSGMTNGGTIIAGIASNRAQDAAANGNSASTSTDNMVIFSVDTTTTITSDAPDPSAVGQSVTVNFTVTAGSLTPTGTVTITDSASAATCTATVAVGTCNLTLPNAGVHTLTATYPGSSAFNGSSDTESHDVSITLSVNTYTDDLTTNGNCSLREAIRAANTNAAVDACPAGSASITDVITLATGTYTLSRAGSDDTAINGDLDIAGDTRITGAGATNTLVSGGSLDRVFQILSGTAQFEGLTVKNGRNTTGAGIHNAGNLTLNNVTVTANTAGSGAFGTSQGAGLYNIGTLTLNSSTVSSNAATAGTLGTSRGAGIYNNGGTLTLNSSVVTLNAAVSGALGTSQGGGIYTTGGSTTLNSTTPSGNTVTAGAGGTAQGPNTYP